MQELLDVWRMYLVYNYVDRALAKPPTQHRIRLQLIIRKSIRRSTRPRCQHGTTIFQMNPNDMLAHVRTKLLLETDVCDPHLEPALVPLLYQSPGIAH